MDDLPVLIIKLSSFWLPRIFSSLSPLSKSKLLSRPKSILKPMITRKSGEFSINMKRYKEKCLKL